MKSKKLLALVVSLCTVTAIFVGVGIKNQDNPVQVSAKDWYDDYYSSKYGGSPSTQRPWTTNVQEITNLVKRAYLNFLGREGDAPGVSDWTSKLSGRKMSAEQFFTAIILSPEGLKKTWDANGLVNALSKVVDVTLTNYQKNKLVREFNKELYKGYYKAVTELVEDFCDLNVVKNKLINIGIVPEW